MSEAVCPICGRNTLIVFKCESCGRDVCSYCVRNPGAQPGQICKECDLKRSTKKPTPTRALSGYAEYFWLLAMNWKPVENRNWPLTRYFKRGQLPVRIYLHASKNAVKKDDVEYIRSILTDKQWAEFSAVDWTKYRGKIIGEITITDQVTPEDIGMKVTHSRWFFGEYGFVVQDGELYEHPVPCRGALGFFPVTLQGTGM
jgi:hypothetical protein